MKSLLLALVTLLLSPEAAQAGAEHYRFDRKLGAAERRALLPKYVSYIRERAKLVPSPADNQQFRVMAAFLTNPIYAAFSADNQKIVGQQSHSVKDLVDMLERSAEEAKQLGDQEREASTARMLEGFQGAENPKLVCQLGYSSAGKRPTDRIVKCEDDRSTPGRGDDEGYYDMRRFILSIDAQTLEPVGVMHLEHEQAG